MPSFVFPGLEDGLRYRLNINTIPVKVLASTFFFFFYDYIIYVKLKKNLTDSILRVFSTRNCITGLVYYKHNTFEKIL